jgi:hypothetical protein
VRGGWPAEQRLWLGPNRHRRRSGDSAATSHPDSYAHSNSFGHSMRTDSYADTDGYANSYSNTYRYGDSHRYSYTNAQTDAHTEICAHTETSSYPSAKTVAVFAKANLSRSATGVMYDRSASILHHCACTLPRRAMQPWGTSQNNVDTSFRIQVKSAFHR